MKNVTPFQSIISRSHYKETSYLSHADHVVTLREQNLFLKWCQPLELLIDLMKATRSLHTSDMGSVGQRVAKLLGGCQS